MTLYKMPEWVGASVSGRRLRANSITPSSSRPGQLVRELVCDLLWLNSIMLSRSQIWFPTCRRQVRAISTCRDSSNLVADRFRPYSITLFCSLAGRSPVRDQIPLRCSACDQLASWSQAGQRNGIWSRTGLRPASELDSVMKFGLRHAHDVHTQVFVQLLAAHEPARELRPARELVASSTV